MKFSPARFNRLLAKTMNQRFAWRKAFACPCVDPYSGQGEPSCPRCGGIGRSWAAEVEGVAAVTMQNQQKLMAMFGYWEPGDALMTIGSDAPFYECGYYDRFRLLNSSANFSINLQRGGNERLIGSVIGITRVFWLNDAGDTEIEGGIPDINEAGVLSWSANAPPSGKMYSITGSRYNEYFVWMQQPSKRNVGIDGLPVKAPLRRFDIMARAG